MDGRQRGRQTHRQTEAGQKVQPVSTSVERIAAADTKGAHLKWMFELTVILVRELENSKTDHAGDPFFVPYITITPGDMMRLDSMIRCALKCQLQSRWWINKMKKVKSKTHKKDQNLCVFQTLLDFLENPFLNQSKATTFSVLHRGSDRGAAFKALNMPRYTTLRRFLWKQSAALYCGFTFTWKRKGII